MPTVPPLTITEAERVELQRQVRAHTTPQRAAKRARIVLLAADGLPNRQIAPIVGMHEHTVAQWRRRFQTERLAGLQDRKRPGRPLVYDHDQRLRIVATVTQEPPDPDSHWSHSQLAQALSDIGISASQIGRILADLDIKPVPSRRCFSLIGPRMTLSMPQRLVSSSSNIRDEPLYLLLLRLLADLSGHAIKARLAWLLHGVTA